VKQRRRAMMKRKKKKKKTQRSGRGEKEEWKGREGGVERKRKRSERGEEEEWKGRERGVEGERKKSGRGEKEVWKGRGRRKKPPKHISADYTHTHIYTHKRDTVLGDLLVHEGADEELAQGIVAHLQVCTYRLERRPGGCSSVAHTLRLRLGC
jgi:hypothetical protein